MFEKLKQSYLTYLRISLLIFIGFSKTCFGQSDWDWLSRLPMSKDLNSVTYGNGRFVAVGCQGIVLASPDGIDWTVKNADVIRDPNIGTMVALNAVIYAKNRFIVVGECFLYSSDAENWVTLDSFKVIQGPGDTIVSSSQLRLKSVANNDSIVVAVGDWGTIMTSPDGLIWTKIAGDFSSSEDISSITYGKNQFVAVSNKPSSNYSSYHSLSLTSPDGKNWTETDSIASCRLLAIAYGNGLYVAVGEQGLIMTSSNGSSWAARSIDSNSQLTSVIYNNNKFVTVGFRYDSPNPNSSKILTSSDGITWTKNDSGSNGVLGSVAYGSGTFVTVGQSGTIETSPDAQTWTMITKGVDNNLHTLAYGNGMYVTSGEPILLSSPDGKTWTVRQIGKNSCNLGQVIYGNNQFIALADSGCGFTETMKPVSFTSSDGINWTQHVQVLDTEVQSGPIMIAYGNGRFYGLGPDSSQMVACPWDPPNWTSCSKITYCDFSSSDGITWTKGALRLFTGLNSSVPSLTYCNGFFFILGDAGTILTSPNGTTWTKQNSNTVSILRSVTYGDGQFVVVGTTILTSRDGRAWEEISNGDEQNFGLLNSVAYGNGQFVAVSRNLYFSPDGKNWTKKDLNILYGFNSIVFADSQFIAVGDIGMIIGSGDGAKWSLYYLLGKNQQTPTAISLQNPQGDSKYKSTKKNNAIIAKIKIANKVFSSRLPLSFARGPFSAELFNSMGKRIFSSSATVFDQTMNISIYRVPTGVYFMSIKDVNNNGFSTRLFITK